MRIGEIAALVGVTSRAVRHYHHIGLLPEPARRANGYRAYSVRDAVLLARIRRLTELGLGLDEVRDVLADDAGRELVEVLGELDADLARQEHEIRERRRRLAGLLEGPVSGHEPVSPHSGPCSARHRTRTPPQPSRTASIWRCSTGPTAPTRCTPPCGRWPRTLPYCACTSGSTSWSTPRWTTPASPRWPPIWPLSCRPRCSL